MVTKTLKNIWHYLIFSLSSSQAIQLLGKKPKPEEKYIKMLLRKIIHNSWK